MDRQNIVFVENRIERIAENEPPVTMLTAFFQLNVRDPNANQYTYKEIPHKYWYNAQTKQWTERVDLEQGSRVIPRMAFMTPYNGELFYLKLLLLHVRGPTSFEYLKTVNGRVYDTFKQAARALNLVENNRQWYELMQEAVQNELPYRIR